jgi:hypothetical protein
MEPLTLDRARGNMLRAREALEMYRCGSDRQEFQRLFDAVERATAEYTQLLNESMRKKYSHLLNESFAAATGNFASSITSS